MSVWRTRRMVPARSMARMRSMTSSTGRPQARAISRMGSRTKPAMRSSETARMRALISSVWLMAEVADIGLTLAKVRAGRNDGLQKKTFRLAGLVLQVAMAAKPESHHHPSIDGAAWLRGNGLRATRGRIAIVELLDASTVPLTLADIHEKVRKEGCDFATVFRFISILEKRSWCNAWRGSTGRRGTRSRRGTGIITIII